MCDHCGKKRGHVGVAVEGEESGSVHRVWVPGAMGVAPDSGESQTAVVPVTLRDPLRV